MLRLRMDDNSSGLTPSFRGHERDSRLDICDRFAVQEDVEGGSILNQGRSVAVGDGPARCYDLDGADPVLLGQKSVFRTVEDLKLP